MISTNGSKTKLFDKDHITLSIMHPASLYFSLVLPAYNEEKRIGITLREYISYFNSRGFKYEVIVVDDGSKDKT